MDRPEAEALARVFNEILGEEEIVSAEDAHLIAAHVRMAVAAGVDPRTFDDDVLAASVAYFPNGSPSMTPSLSPSEAPVSLRRIITKIGKVAK
jgi:hypothetical protein